MSGDGDPARLERLLGGSDLDWLLARIRRRLELGQDLVGTVVLQQATPEQRAAVARLFGVPLRPGTAATARLEDLDLLLRRSGAWPAGLQGAVVALIGPYARRAEARRANLRAYEAAWSPLTDALAHHPRPELREPLLAWWHGERTSAGGARAVRTPQDAAALARDLAAVLQRLPAPGIAIGSLAHAATGSAHALDRGTLAGLVLRASRVIADLPPSRVRSAEVDRETWAAVGVVRDETSSTVLTLGLPARPAGATGRAMAAWGAVGQPVLLTLRHLRLDPPQWEAPRGSGTVWVVENPVVLTAVADRVLERDGERDVEHGRAALPVLCTAGWPSSAAVEVLRGLGGAGWALRHHGDLDPDGVAITDHLVREVGVTPWRMSAADYRWAVAAGRGRPAPMGAPNASWDAELGVAMDLAQQVVEEEALLEELVHDVVGD